MNNRKSIGNNIRLEKIAALTFGIYIVHPIFIEVFSHLDISSKTASVICLPLITIVVMIISGVVTFVIKKIPLLNKLITF